MQIIRQYDKKYKSEWWWGADAECINIGVGNSENRSNDDIIIKIRAGRAESKVEERDKIENKK